MQEVLEFNFVYAPDAVTVKSFLGRIPRSIGCINYINILNKLEKNDFLKQEPSDIVLSSYLIKNLNLALSKKDVNCIYYVLSSLDDSILDNIRYHISSVTEKPIKFFLHLAEESKFEGEFDFETVSFFE